MVSDVTKFSTNQKFVKYFRFFKKFLKMAMNFQTKYFCISYSFYQILRHRQLNIRLELLNYHANGCYLLRLYMYVHLLRQFIC